MLRNLSVAVFICFSGTAYAAGVQAPVPPASATVTLTEQQIEMVGTALNMAASMCSQSTVACAIGMDKGPVLQQLEDARSQLMKDKTKQEGR